MPLLFSVGGRACLPSELGQKKQLVTEPLTVSMEWLRLRNVDVIGLGLMPLRNADVIGFGLMPRTVGVPLQGLGANATRATVGCLTRRCSMFLSESPSTRIP